MSERRNFQPRAAREWSAGKARDAIRRMHSDRNALPWQRARQIGHAPFLGASGPSNTAPFESDVANGGVVHRAPDEES